MHCCLLYNALRVAQLLDCVGSVDTVRSVLKHILDCVSFSVPFPKLSKTLLKVRTSVIAVHMSVCVSLNLDLCNVH